MITTGSKSKEEAQKQILPKKETMMKNLTKYTLET